MKVVSRRKLPQLAIDAIDRRILAALQEDANVGLAEKVGPIPVAMPRSRSRARAKPAVS